MYVPIQLLAGPPPSHPPTPCDMAEWARKKNPTMPCRDLVCFYTICAPLGEKAAIVLFPSVRGKSKAGCLLRSRDVLGGRRID